MNNKDWTVKERELEKEFYFENAAEARKFIHLLKKLADAEGHHPVIKKKGSKIVSVKIPVAGPELYEEKDIRLANLINRIAN